MDDLKLYDSSETEPDKVWNILRNAIEDMQIEFGMEKMQTIWTGTGPIHLFILREYQHDIYKLNSWGKKHTHVDFLQVKEDSVCSQH